MTKQYSTALRDAWLDTYESEIGTDPLLDIRTGPPPANCAAADSGTQLAELELPTDWMGAPSSGTSAKAGTWSGSIVADGTAGHYRLKDTTGTTCHEQGSITRAFPLTTSSTTAANSNVLTFASTSGVSNGMSITGTGVPAGATVADTTSTTVIMSAISTAGVGSAVTIYFGDTAGDLWLSNTALSTGGTLTISTRSLTAPGA